MAAAQKKMSKTLIFASVGSNVWTLCIAWLYFVNDGVVSCVFVMRVICPDESDSLVLNLTAWSLTVFSVCCNSHNCPFQYWLFSLLLLLSLFVLSLVSYLVGIVLPQWIIGSLLLLRSQPYLWASPFLRMWLFFDHVPSSEMMHARCVFVAGIHPSRTWTSGSFESVRWNACVHRLALGLYSHPKEF